MNYPVSFADAAKEFPAETAAALAKLRMSRCRKRNEDPNNLPWCYSLGVHIQGVSFDEIINPKPKPVLTLEQKLQDLIKRTEACIMVTASKDSWYFEPLPNPPKVYIDQQREGLEKEEKRNRRFNALPKAEQDKEIGKLLGELGQDPGFMAITIGKKP